MRKYFLMVFYSLIYNGKNRKEIIVRSSFFLAILFIFYQLWQSTDFIDSTKPEQMIWYLSITELIVLSIPLVQVDIENDIRSGDVVYQLLKPVDYLRLKLSENVGAFLCRFFFLMLIAIPFCTLLSGYMPPIHYLLCVYIVAMMAGMVFLLFHAMIGLLAFKLHDSSPIFWIWQRSSFLFGGLVIPLDFYPYYLKIASFFLPFSALLYGPAKLINDFTFETFLMVLGGLIFWGLVALGLSKSLYNKMLRSLKVNGG